MAATPWRERSRAQEVGRKPQVAPPFARPNASLTIAAWSALDRGLADEAGAAGGDGFGAPDASPSPGFPETPFDRLDAGRGGGEEGSCPAPCEAGRRARRRIAPPCSAPTSAASASASQATPISRGLAPRRLAAASRPSAVSTEARIAVAPSSIALQHLAHGELRRQALHARRTRASRAASPRKARRA